MADVIKAKHAEIERRYKRRRGKRPRPSLSALRIHDLNKLFAARYGHALPDDDAGKDDAQVMAHHLAALSGDPRKRINGWLRLWCPWMSLADAEAVLAEAILRPQRWRADKLAWRLRLTEADRSALRITTIGAVDLGRSERTKRRRDRAKLRKQMLRRAAGAKPRAQYEANSINRTKPWIALGMSRAAWYRAGKPAP